MAIVVVLQIWLCLFYLSCIKGLDNHINSCFMGTKRPFRIETTELPGRDAVHIGDLETTFHGGVTIDPCKYQTRSILEVSWNNSGDVFAVSQTFCLTLEYLSNNSTRCYRLSSIKKRKSRLTCWIHVVWRDGVCVIGAFVQNDSGVTTHSGHKLFSQSCEDICDEHFPNNYAVKVLNCGVISKLNVSAETQIKYIQLVAKGGKQEQSYLVNFTQTKIETTKDLYIDENITTGEYALEIHTTIDNIPQDHPCTFEIPVYVICGSPRLRRPSTRTADTKINTLTLALAIGFPMVITLVLVIIIIVYRAHRTRHIPGQHQPIPLNNIFDQPTESERLNGHSTYV